MGCGPQQIDCGPQQIKAEPSNSRLKKLHVLRAATQFIAGRNISRQRDLSWGEEFVLIAGRNGSYCGPQ
jgi:hypothetical protein